MKQSKYLAGACSAILLAAWALPDFADAGESQGQVQQQDQKQSRQKAGEQQRTAEAHGGQAVIDSAGKPTDVLVVGKVTEARNVTLAGPAGDNHRLLKVMPNGGKEVVVDIDVRSEQKSGMQLEKGDRIVAMGKPARINGRPVLFAADVAELQRVTTGSSSGAKQSKASPEDSATAKNASQSGQREDGYVAVLHRFDSDNFAEDEHGIYDTDFVWTTSDPMYDSWNDTATAWEQSERAHYDMFGYDDAGEAGWWDW